MDCRHRDINAADRVCGCAFGGLRPRQRRIEINGEARAIVLHQGEFGLDLGAAPVKLQTALGSGLHMAERGIEPRKRLIE